MPDRLVIGSSPSGGQDTIRGSASPLYGSRTLCDRTAVPSTWTELRVTLPAEHAEAVGNFLVDAGSAGLQIEENGSSTTLIAYFGTEAPLEELAHYWADIAPGQVEALHTATARVTDTGWAENWKLHFSPQLVGRRLCVLPSWAVAPENRMAIVIDPGMAFGTGHHVTTRHCLERLEQTCATQSVRRALDVGTGTGVLAIALAKLGVAEVWAVDTDPAACDIATANARHNGVSDRVHVDSAWPDPTLRFGLVVANLHADPLIALAARFAAVVAAAGSVIVSGLLLADEARVRDALTAAGLQIAERRVEGDWVTLAWRAP